MELETIQKRIEQLEQAQQELKVLKLTLDDALKEDAKYQELDLQIRDLNMQKKRVKDEVWQQQTYKEAQNKIKEIKNDLKDLIDILNHELLEWRLANQSEEIIGADGTPRKFKVNVRIQPPRGASSGFGG